MKTLISAPSPVPYTLPEACAYIYTQQKTKANYVATRLEAKKRFADIYPPYDKIREYRKNNCSPRGIVFSETEVVAPLQAVLDHQMEKMLDDPNLRDRVSVLAENGPLELLSKYGSDNMSQVLSVSIVFPFNPYSIINSFYFI